MSAINQNETEQQETIDVDVDPRTRRACEGCMIVVPRRNGSGQFDVYSANNGTNKTYAVDLRAETCSCPDFERREPAGGCKHVRRVKLGLGLMAVPEGADLDLDSALIRDRAKYGVDPEITVHIENPDQGGATYFKCECGREAMRRKDLLGAEHRAECPYRS